MQYILPSNNSNIYISHNKSTLQYPSHAIFFKSSALLWSNISKCYQAIDKDSPLNSPIAIRVRLCPAQVRFSLSKVLDASIS